jgi:hypothetical protein
MSKKHPGFKKVAKRIAGKEKISLKRARAELAVGTRRAGKAARKKNPRLDRVKGWL